MQACEAPTHQQLYTDVQLTLIMQYSTFCLILLFFQPADETITSSSSTLINSTTLFGAWRDCKHRYPLHWYGVWIYHLRFPLVKHKLVWHRYVYACLGCRDLIARKVSATASALQRWSHRSAQTYLITRSECLVYMAVAEVDVDTASVVIV